jgi:hypothetical protein
LDKLFWFFLISLLGSFSIGIGLKVIVLTFEQVFTGAGFIDGSMLICNGVFSLYYGLKNILSFLKESQTTL